MALMISSVDSWSQPPLETQSRPPKGMSGGKLEPLPERRPDVKGYIAGPRYFPHHADCCQCNNPRKRKASAGSVGSIDSGPRR